jgi:hypothetical protein
MINLEITVHPKDNKIVEFSQSLESVQAALEKYCSYLTMTRDGKIFRIVAELETVDHLRKLMASMELRVLSGAIKVLGKESGIKIHSNNFERNGADLRKVGLNFLKIKRDKGQMEIP